MYGNARVVVHSLQWPIRFPAPTEEHALTPVSKRLIGWTWSPQVFREYCSSQRMCCLLQFPLGMAHNQPVLYHWPWITATSAGASSSQVEIVQTLTQAAWDNTYLLFFTSWFHLAPTLLTCHEKRSQSHRQGMVLKTTLFCQSFLEAKLCFASLSGRDHTLSWHSSVSPRAFSHLQRTCPCHMFSATCHKKIYQNLGTKAVFPFTNGQIKSALKTRIITGMSPFVADFMCPFSPHADSCFTA